MPIDVFSYVIGAVSGLAALGLILAIRHLTRARRARARASERSREQRARRDRHEAQKSRVRFVPSKTLTDDQ